MRILQLTNRLPYPPKDGGAIGMFNFTKSYAELGNDVTLLSVNTPKHLADPEKIPPAFSGLADVHLVYVDTRVKPVPAFLNLLNKKSYNIERFDSPAFRGKLQHILQEKTFDVIHVDGLFMSMYNDIIREYSNALLVMRAHNVEHLIWKRLSEAEKNGPKKQYLSVLARKLKRYEKKKLNEFDLILPISEVDDKSLKALGSKAKHIIVPAGVDMDKFQPDPEETEFPSLFHLGSLDWMPNQQALRWFVDEVWPELHKRFPKLTFSIAGRNMPKWIQHLQRPGIEIAGEVPDAVDYMNSKAIMIVPLLSGSGMRLKILEGMALGKTVVTTNIGAEGIEYEEGRHLLIANGREEFISQISGIVQDKARAEAVGQQAIELIREKYTNRQIVKTLLEEYQKLLT